MPIRIVLWANRSGGSVIMLGAERDYKGWQAAHKVKRYIYETYYIYHAHYPTALRDAAMAPM